MLAFLYIAGFTLIGMALMAVAYLIHPLLAGAFFVFLVFKAFAQPSLNTFPPPGLVKAGRAPWAKRWLARARANRLREEAVSANGQRSSRLISDGSRGQSICRDRAG